jgi:hypothetical protein
MVEITLLIAEVFNGKLKAGLDFEFKEGSRVIGTGKILQIFNTELLSRS